jgi:hypothetical protein
MYTNVGYNLGPHDVKDAFHDFVPDHSAYGRLHRKIDATIACNICAAAECIFSTRKAMSPFIHAWDRQWQLVRHDRLDAILKHIGQGEWHSCPESLHYFKTLGETEYHSRNAQIVRARSSGETKDLPQFDPLECEEFVFSPGLYGAEQGGWVRKAESENVVAVFRQRLAPIIGSFQLPVAGSLQESEEMRNRLQLRSQLRHHYYNLETGYAWGARPTNLLRFDSISQLVRSVSWPDGSGERLEWLDWCREVRTIMK